MVPKCRWYVGNTALYHYLSGNTANVEPKSWQVAFTWWPSVQKGWWEGRNWNFHSQSRLPCTTDLFSHCHHFFTHRRHVPKMTSFIIPDITLLIHTLWIGGSRLTHPYKQTYVMIFAFQMLSIILRSSLGSIMLRSNHRVSDNEQQSPMLLMLNRPHHSTPPKATVKYGCSKSLLAYTGNRDVTSPTVISLFGDQSKLLVYHLLASFLLQEPFLLCCRISCCLTKLWKLTFGVKTNPSFQFKFNLHLLKLLILSCRSHLNGLKFDWPFYTALAVTWSSTFTLILRV